MFLKTFPTFNSFFTAQYDKLHTITKMSCYLRYLFTSVIKDRAEVLIALWSQHWPTMGKAHDQVQ